MRKKPAILDSSNIRISNLTINSVIVAFPLITTSYGKTDLDRIYYWISVDASMLIKSFF